MIWGLVWYDVIGLSARHGIGLKSPMSPRAWVSAQAQFLCKLQLPSWVRLINIFSFLDTAGALFSSTQIFLAMWPSVPFGSCFFKLSRRSDTIQPSLYVLCSPWLKTSPRYKFSCDTTQAGQSNASYLPWRWSRMCGQGWWSSLRSSLMKGESRWWRGAWGEPGFILKSESTQQPL